MASSSLKPVLTPQLLGELRDFWFEHIDTNDASILPTTNHFMRWFMGGKEFDEICVKRFAPALEAIRSSGITTGKALLDIVQPSTPLDWLSLVLLLDQIPRNCYRGDVSSIAFQVFDPIAQDVALAAMAQGIPDESPEIRWHLSRRMWFYVPLMHSEDLAQHGKATAEYERMASDVESLIAEPELGNKEQEQQHRKNAARVIGANVEGARQTVGSQVEFEKKHYDIIKRFGRYPHRNKAMGREMRVEEQEYLDNGGETFSA